MSEPAQEWGFLMPFLVPSSAEETLRGITLVPQLSGRVVSIAWDLPSIRLAALLSGNSSHLGHFQKTRNEKLVSKGISGGRVNVIVPFLAGQELRLMFTGGLGFTGWLETEKCSAPTVAFDVARSHTVSELSKEGRMAGGTGRGQGEQP